MKFPILASVIILCSVIHLVTRKSSRDTENEEAAFWERERRANSTRKKSLEHLNYIKIPFDSLPMDELPDNPTVCEVLSVLKELDKSPIVNLTGYTNTDLKLEYGTANITKLTQYDQSYTLLASTLQKWADTLWDAGKKEEAVRVMEFSLSTQTDVSRAYYRLAEYYLSAGRKEELARLTETAGALRSSNREQILRHLSEFSAG